MAWKRFSNFPRFWSLSRRIGKNIVLRGRNGKRKIMNWVLNNAFYNKTIKANFKNHVDSIEFGVKTKNGNIGRYVFTDYIGNFI